MAAEPILAARPLANCLRGAARGGGGDANFSSRHESYRRSVNDFTLVPVTWRFPDCVSLSLSLSGENEAASSPPHLPPADSAVLARRKIRSCGGKPIALSERPPRRRRRILCPLSFSHAFVAIVNARCAA